MKKLFFAMALVFAFTTGRAQTVGTDVGLGVSLKEYKTYNWTAGIEKIPTDKVIVGTTGVLVYNNASGRKMIKDAIAYELDASRKQKVTANPDMLVNFMVFEQPGKLRTYNGYELVNLGADTVRTEDNVEYTDFKAGTLLINFTDADSNRIIWQGYASGILDNTKIKDQSAVREAVSSIFNKIDV